MKHQDTIINSIKSGDKNALLLLYKASCQPAYRALASEKHSKRQIREFVREAVLKTWDSVQAGDPRAEKDVAAYVNSLVLLAASNADAQVFLSRKTLPFYDFRGWSFSSTILIPAISGGLIFLLIWVFNSKPAIVNFIRLPVPALTDSLDEIPAQMNAQLQKTVEKKADKTAKIHSDSLRKMITSADSSSTKVPDSSLFAGKTAAGFPEVKEAETMEELHPETETAAEHLVVKKDRLLFSRTLPLISAAEETAEHEVSDAAAKLLNPEAGLPEPERDALPKTFLVEYWESPLNYRGYKLSKNKMIVFGLTANELFSLHHIDNLLYMELNQAWYRLERSSGFSPFIPVKDPGPVTKSGLAK